MSAQWHRWRAHCGPLCVLCAGLMLCVMLLPWIPGMALAACAAAATALFGARVPWRTYLAAISLPLGFIAASGAVLCLSLSWKAGHPVLAWSPSGLQRAMTASVRSFCAMSVTVLWACTVPCSYWLSVLRRCRVPESLLDLILLVYRMIFLLDEQRACLIRAQENRLGYRSLATAYRSTALAAHALFTATLARAARWEKGLAARGYTDRLVTLEAFPRSTPAAYVLAVLAPAAVALGGMGLHCGRLA